MIWQLLEGAFYLALAGAVTAVNWHRPARLTGVALMIYSGLSSLTFFFGSFEFNVLLEIALATFMSVIAWTLWHEGESRVSHQIVMAASIIDLALCSIITIRSETDFPARMTFTIGANAAFTVMCIAVFIPGAADHVRRWVRRINDLRMGGSATPDFDFLLKRLDK